MPDSKTMPLPPGIFCSHDKNYFVSVYCAKIHRTIFMGSYDTLELANNRLRLFIKNTNQQPQKSYLTF